MALSSSQSTTSVSWQDFVALPESDLRELIDGALFVIEVPNKTHEYIVALLAFHLNAWLRTQNQRQGLVLGSAFKVRISDTQAVMPDLQYYGPEKAPHVPSDGLSHGHPDLVVEVISESSRSYDRVIKLAWYATLGVPEYWIIDPLSQTIEQLILEPSGHYRIQSALAKTDTFKPQSFPGLCIQLQEVFRK